MKKRDKGKHKNGQISRVSAFFCRFEVHFCANVSDFLGYIQKMLYLCAQIKVASLLLTIFALTIDNCYIG